MNKDIEEFQQKTIKIIKTIKILEIKSEIVEKKKFTGCP